MSNNNESPEEKARRLGVPLIPKLPELPPHQPNPVVAVCGECGIELHQIMGYVCNRPRCPTGMGGPVC